MKKINRELLKKLKELFVLYTDQFTSNDFFVQKHFKVKQQHTFEVCRNVVEIGKRLDLNETQLIIAEITALFHDIGRFEQYKQYRTFSDHDSVNHAELGVQVIKEQDFLKDIDPVSTKLIIKTILNHNKPCLRLDDPELDLYSKLLRDADKLDIYRVVKEYELQENNLLPEIENNYKIPDSILNAFTRRQIVDIKSAESKYDLFLLRVSWIFDINFQATFQMLDQGNYLNYFLNQIPKSYRLINIQGVVRKYMVEKIFTYV